MPRMRATTYIYNKAIRNVKCTRYTRRHTFTIEVQHCMIMTDHRESVVLLCIDVKSIGCARMFVVMNQRCYDDSKYFQISHPRLQSSKSAVCIVLLSAIQDKSNLYNSAAVLAESRVMGDISGKSPSLDL